jgi:hypothetical protein
VQQLVETNYARTRPLLVLLQGLPTCYSTSPASLVCAMVAVPWHVSEVKCPLTDEPDRHTSGEWLVVKGTGARENKPSYLSRQRQPSRFSKFQANKGQLVIARLQMP